MSIVRNQDFALGAVEGPMDQETAVEELRERYARGGVPIEEFRRLMGLLMVTTDPAECQAILDQLPPEPARSARASSFRSEGSPSAGSRAKKISAFFGEVDRSGDLWELGPETTVNATFGEVRVDVRMAKLTEGENVLYLNALFGEIVVTVPEGLRVITRLAYPVEHFTFGMPMRLRIVSLHTDDNGDDVVTYEFTPEDTP